jgi:hypothetical protein
MNQFAVVTFAWSFALALFVLWKLFFRCLHDWEPVVERELPAVAEVIDKAEVNRWGSAILTYKAGRKKFFAIISCKKCGAVKEFQTLSGQGHLEEDR